MSALKNLMRTMFRTGDADANAAAEVDSKDLLKRADDAARAGRLTEALELYDTCLSYDPRSFDACLGAAAVLVDLWALDDAVTAYERAHEMAPASAAIYSALLFHRHYLTPVDAQALFRAHQRFGEVAAKAKPARATHDDAARRLRIGYVSPNFSRHSVGYFVAPVIRCHDRQHYEVICYYNHALADDATQRMREAADGWREIAGCNDDAVERMVRDDRIDILVDLAGHSKGNRLAVFARRPAPVQFTWLGYPDTTGLGSIDYRVTDFTADPLPAAQARHSEKLASIDGCFVCYEPPADAPVVKARAADRPVTFGSFNNLAKINPQTLVLWKRILDAVPGSRLVVKCAPLNFPDTVDRMTEALEESGLDPARVDLRGWTNAREQHLDAYAEIDVALDTFPYNGTTTTCEALWMGVPVVSLAGEVHMSRVGASLLQSADLGEFIARDEADYVRIACELALNAERRRELRSTLRTRIEASPLLDHAGFTRKLEAQYRQAWQECCARR